MLSKESKMQKDPYTIYQNICMENCKTVKTVHTHIFVRQRYENMHGQGITTSRVANALGKGEMAMGFESERRTQRICVSSYILRNKSK